MYNIIVYNFHGLESEGFSPLGFSLKIDLYIINMNKSKGGMNYGMV